MKTRIEEAFKDFINKVSNNRTLAINRLDLHKKTFIAGTEFMQGEVDKLKDFWKPIMDKFETKYPNAGNANTIALTALTESFDIHCENEKLKELLEKAESHLKHVSECEHPYTIHEHRETLEHR